MDIDKCWTGCGGSGIPIAGQAGLRRCPNCEVEWVALPPAPQREHDRVFARGRELDKVAARYGLGNRLGFMDHVPGELASPA